MAGVMQKNATSKHYCKSCGEENHCGRINYTEDGEVKCGICKCAICYPRKVPVRRGWYMVNFEEKNNCVNCNHECHCDNIVCDTLVGIGMSDKSESCGCGICDCTPKRPDWG